VESGDRHGFPVSGRPNSETSTASREWRLRYRASQGNNGGPLERHRASTVVSTTSRVIEAFTFGGSGKRRIALVQPYFRLMYECNGDQAAPNELAPYVNQHLNLTQARLWPL